MPQRKEWNAIAEAETPRFDQLFRDSPWTTLEASGLAVGLPPGQMGNSEVGHLNIGAGRIVDQDIVRISKSIANHELAKNAVFVDAVKKSNRIHFAGLLSDGGVHSLQEHLHGLIAAAIELGAKNVFVHAILDGRDTPPKSAEKYLQQLLDFIAKRPQVKLSTIIGRYFTMDRDKRWDRVQRGYDLMTLAVGTQQRAARDRAALLRAERDGRVHGADRRARRKRLASRKDRRRRRALFFNFRADRMRQIVTAFKDDDFDGFKRTARPKATLVTLNQYHEDFGLPVVYPPQAVKNNLGEVFSRAGLKQLRIAETEKFAHVTFFFNGGSDTQFTGEERVLIPSPKVATYDLKPEMSLSELSDRVVQEIEAKKYDVIVLNIANPDMVGHTGVMKAAVEAVHDTDIAVGKILDAVAKVDGVALITADHGNCELMFDPETNQPHTAHTTNPVPLILFDPKRRFDKLRSGGALENVAPTILHILGIEQPKEMTAESLV